MTQKILVVDDEAEIVRLVRAYLERAGFAVVTASEGRQALAGEFLVALDQLACGLLFFNDALIDIQQPGFQIDQDFL